ncbi:hypothetical protein NZK32_01890 [Cyanobium sp. FGCU-52]|nr:hypothetical protein [Cyanobium sp. FGCU52]
MASNDLPAATAADPTAWPRRLAEQLRTLSEMGETLTYRLLELEERLAAQELRLAPLLERQGGLEAAAAEDMELRLGDTEERLGRIEAVLNGMERPGGARHLQPLQPSAAPFCLSGPIQQERRPSEEDPFLEEEEQPFMDELPA